MSDADLGLNPNARRRLPPHLFWWNRLRRCRIGVLLRRSCYETKVAPARRTTATISTIRLGRHLADLLKCNG